MVVRQAALLFLVSCVAAVSAAGGRWSIRGSGLTEGLLHALNLLKENPDWMANQKACAKAVDGTLTTLEDEYLNPYVAFVLGTACEHHNVYKDFGGSEVSCKPVFQDLGARFDAGKKDYAGWCAGTVSLVGGSVGGAGGASGAAGAKASKVEKARSEMNRLKDKHANGEDIRGDLEKLKAELAEADQDAETARALEKKAHADDRYANGGAGSANKRGEAGGASTTAHVGGSRWGAAAPEGTPTGAGKGPGFGAEASAQKLTKESAGEADAMVDQIEKAQIAEERRSAYRALTHLRHSTVSSFDAMAHAHMQNIHEHGEQKKWRSTNPIAHLAEEEGDVQGWAFPTR